MEYEPLERERPNRDNVHKGDLVFIITWDDEVVSGEVTSVYRGGVNVRDRSDDDNFIPYARVAFPRVYGGFLMGVTIERRLFPGAV